MDDRQLRRIANICKVYYTLDKVDDLFIYAGAKPGWIISEPQSMPNPSQRFTRCVGWVEGIQQNAPGLVDQIVKKVVNRMIDNPEIVEKENIDLCILVGELEAKSKEEGIQIEPLLSTVSRSLASDGLARELAILISAEPRLDWTDHDRFGEVDVYQLVLSIPYKLYDQVKDERDECEQRIYGHIRPFMNTIQKEDICRVVIACQLLDDNAWRDKALAWLSGQKVNNQGRVRSDNVAPRTADGLQFRSESEILLYRALKSQGMIFAPLPVFIQGGKSYQRVEPDFVVIKEGIVMIVEVDGDTYHKESPAEAYTRTRMFEHEGARVMHVQANKCDTPEKAAACALEVLQTIAKLKEAAR